MTQETEDQDFQSVEFWKEHFDPSCTISLQYYTVDDGTKILTVFAEHPENSSEPTVTMVPGWFSRIHGWTEVTREISKHRSIFYVETREKRSSILPSHDVLMSVERMADDLTQITHLMPFDFKKSVVVASSMGGTVMLEYLGRMKNLPYASILIGPNAEFDAPKTILRVALKLPTFVVNPMKWAIKMYIRIFKVNMKKEPQQYQKYADVLDNAEPWKIKESAKQCLWYEAWGILRQAHIESKVILVGASADKMHDAHMTHKINEAIVGSNYVDFPSNKATHSIEMGEYIVEVTKGKLPVSPVVPESD